MGFSVSGSAVVIFLAAFISVGVLYTAAYNGYERVNEAEQAADEELLEQRNTAVNVTRATYNSTSGTLTVQVQNDGTTTLGVNATDLLVDGAYQDQWASWNVSGRSNTDLWLPGETLNVTVETASPSRVKVITESGVADAEAV